MRKKIEGCLYNWLGYGNLNGNIWFLGTEEGGAEIWRKGIKTQTLESSLGIRSEFELAEDFVNVWEEKYNIPLNSFKGPSVWRFMAAFLLKFNLKEIIKEDLNKFKNDVKEYIFLDKNLGRKESNHFIGELYPLPKKSKDSIKEYKSIWGSNKEYHFEIENKRFNLIRETIDKNLEIKLYKVYY